MEGFGNYLHATAWAAIVLAGSVQYAVWDLLGSLEESEIVHCRSPTVEDTCSDASASSARHEALPVSTHACCLGLKSWESDLSCSSPTSSQTCATDFLHHHPTLRTWL
ncbi:hypothetical protein WJX73_005972 [Symbiochloris irregularis]|uniref:Uncharacterized protein n=1 Tax=Symbiochloris irregularis TaxID=706552 RepID=A0AAW1NNT0_9CHLO